MKVAEKDMPYSPLFETIEVMIVFVNVISGTGVLQFCATDFQ